MLAGVRVDELRSRICRDVSPGEWKMVYRSGKPLGQRIHQLRYGRSPKSDREE
jgi:hypothetical protein